MKTLIIIPSLQHKFTFSAPLSWLFAKHTDRVRGIYGHDLKKHDLKNIELCVVELNWFIELCEFMLIIKFIRKHNKECKILFGGLYAQLKYKEILTECDVDYFIKGFAEKPMQMLLDGEDPRTIPNLVGTNFENPVTYRFSTDQYKDIEYSLDWFPDYKKYWGLFPQPDLDIDPDFSGMPLIPAYHYPKKIKDPAKTFRVPPRGGRYHLPMLITSRGVCSAIHEGCDYCMGSKTRELQEIYNCDAVVMDNDTLIAELHKVSAKFKRASLFINSAFTYDFTGHTFDLDITIEVDSKVTPEQLSKVIYAFDNAKVHLVLYENGHQTSQSGTVRSNIEDFLKLQDDSHRIYFFAFKTDADNVNLPLQNRLYAEFVFPHWASWEYYNDFDKAYRYSMRWYTLTRQYNLYPIVRRLIMKPLILTVFSIMFVFSKLGIKKMQEEMLFGDRVQK